MSRITKMIGFSVPPAIAEEVGKIAREEQRTKSELFRRMFSVYKTYRRELAQAEEERFERLIDEAIAAGLREKKSGTPPTETLVVEGERLARYGGKQAKALGIQGEDEAAINHLIHEQRKARKERQRA